MTYFTHEAVMLTTDAAGLTLALDASSSPLTLTDALSDDDLALILKKLDAALPFTLACSRVRAIQRAANIALRTSLCDVCASLTLLEWAIKARATPAVAARPALSLFFVRVSAGCWLPVPN